MKFSDDGGSYLLSSIIGSLFIYNTIIFFYGDDFYNIVNSAIDMLRLFCENYW